MASPGLHHLHGKSSPQHPDETVNPFAVRVHPDECMEMGQHPDGASPRCVSLSPSQRPTNLEAPEARMIDSCQRLHPSMYTGGAAGARSMYDSYLDPENVCSPSNSPHPGHLSSDGFDLQVYSEPVRGNAPHPVGIVDTYSEDLGSRKNLSASHGSSVTQMGMFPVAELGNSAPLRPGSATPSVYSHVGSMPPPNRISAQTRARSMVVQSSADENMAGPEDSAVPRSRTMPHSGAGGPDMLDENPNSLPSSFPGFSADATTNVMGQLSGLLNEPESAGLPPGVIAGAHMHRREARTYNNGGGGGAMHVPTSGSENTIVYPNRSDGMSPAQQGSVHSGSGSRPLTEPAVLGVNVSGAMHASMPTRPFTDSACVGGRTHLSPLPGRSTDGGVCGDRSAPLGGNRSASWAGSMATGGPRMCYSNTGGANASDQPMHMDPGAATRSPVRPSMLAEPLETLRLTPDMVYSGNFPGHMGRMAGVQQLQQIQQQQMQDANNNPLNTIPGSLKQSAHDVSASPYAQGRTSQQKPPTGLHWDSRTAQAPQVTVNGNRQFLQGDTLAFLAGDGARARSDSAHATPNPHDSFLLPMSVDCMSGGESDYEDDEKDQDGFSPQPNVLGKPETNSKAGTPQRVSVQGISTPEKPNPALLREWSGYGARPSDSGHMSTREMLAAGVKSTDSAREPSGEPSALGGVAVKQEDSATGDGTSCPTPAGTSKRMGDLEKPPRRKRATGLTAEERRERRRKSNRESARRSRVRKLEETQESETAIATLQNSVTAQAKMLSVATEHLETMKLCLSQQEQRVGTLCEGISKLLTTINTEASMGHVSSPVAKQAEVMRETLMHETSMAAQSRTTPPQ